MLEEEEAGSRQRKDMNLDRIKCEIGKNLEKVRKKIEILKKEDERELAVRERERDFYFQSLFPFTFHLHQSSGRSQSDGSQAED